jgi:predicted HicB family RNase H-like nuclease
MEKKLTFRIEEDVKESAKRLARECGESLSGLVESYFRILT